MVEVNIRLQVPDELVERSRQIGKELGELPKASEIISLLEKELKREEAARWLLETAEQLQSLPDEEKPTQEEIDAIVRDVQRERWAKQQATQTINTTAHKADA